MIEPPPEFVKGVTYKTKGGWPALIIWKRGGIDKNVLGSYYVIHKPGESLESGVTMHDKFGLAYSPFAVSMPPHFEGHPADLTTEEIQIEETQPDV